MVFMMCMITKIGVFSLSDNQNDEFIKKTDILSNKSEMSFKSIRAKIYIYKIFKSSFCITFLRS